MPLPLQRRDDPFGSAYTATSISDVVFQCPLAIVLEEFPSAFAPPSIFDVEEEAPPSLKKKHLHR